MMGRVSSLNFSLHLPVSLADWRPKRTLTSLTMRLVRANHHHPLLPSCRGPALPTPKQGSPFRFSTESRQLPETKFRPKFSRISLIPNGKRIQNSKNEISVNSDRNFGDFDRNFGDFDRKMMSAVIFVLFRRSNEKLLNINIVQFFEIYNFCFRNFFYLSNGLKVI